MTQVYVTLTIITLILASIGTHPRLAYKDTVGNYRPNKIIVGLIMVIYSIISGLRYMNYYQSDEWIYRVGFEALVNKGIGEVLSHKEVGFALLNWGLGRVCDDSQILILVVAIITNVLIIRMIAIYSRPFELGMFLYVAMGLFFTSFNIMRQYLAVAILVAGIRYLFEENFKKYLVYIIGATTIHASSILMIPIYFLITSKYFKQLMPIVIIATVVTLVRFKEVVLQLVVGTQYQHYSMSIEKGLYGVSVIRVMVVCLPVLIMWCYRQRLIERRRENLFLINLLTIGACIMVISTQYVFFARLEILVGIYSLIIIPEFLKLFNDRVSVTLVYIGILILYFIFGLYQASINPIYHTIFYYI